MQGVDKVVRNKPRTEKTGKRKTSPAKEHAMPKTPAPPPETEPQSICIECAKHSSLKGFVKKHGSTGYECGICHRSDLVASAPGVHEALSSLVRALVRFHYDEWIYNGHWGGEQEPYSILCEENPIVEHAAAAGFPRDAGESEGFLMGLFDPPYPDYDKGIAVYAGNDEQIGRLPPLDAISTSSSPLYERIAKRLAKENYFEVENDFAEILAKLEDRINTFLPANTTMFRARIGIAKRFMRTDGGWTSETIFQPYTGSEIGAPPPAKATPGRLNRGGVSFLYLSTDEATAAVEVRPHLGHRVSIASFRSLKTIRLADFGAIDIADFSSSDALLEIFHLGYSISREISLPITPEDRHKYSVTQLLADLIRRQAYDGIRFPSSVAPGANICVFQPDLFSVEPAAGKVVYVKGLKYEVDDMESLVEPTDDDIALP
jgi:RES domain-containing protein